MKLSAALIEHASRYVNQIIPLFSARSGACVHVVSFGVAHALLGVSVTLFQTLHETRNCTAIKDGTTDKEQVHKAVDDYWQQSAAGQVPIYVDPDEPKKKNNRDLH